MLSRSGRTFFVEENFAPMDPSIQDTLNKIIDKIENMDQQLEEIRDQVDVNCRDLATRLDRLEANRGEPQRRKFLETAVGHPGESEFNPTIQLTLMPSLSRALKSMLLPSMGA